MAAHEAQPEPDQSDPSDHSDHSGQSDQSDDNMKDSTRSKALRKSRPPPKKKTRDEPNDAQMKPLNQNDLVKWIVISDAPDHASVHAKFRNAKSYPVLPRSSKYLERFGARNLRTGLKCLRAMTDAARQENEKLEQEAQALGCVDGKMNVEQQLGIGAGQHRNTAKAVVNDPDSSMQVDASKESRIATLRFDMSFYRCKVLPFIQVCLIAEGQLPPLPPRTPVALPFPGGVYQAFESTDQRSAAKAAYDIARAGGLPQESCDTAARRRVGLLSQTAAAPLEADEECPPTPGGFKEHDDSTAPTELQTQTPASGVVPTSSPTHSTFPPTRRAPDFSSSPAVAASTPSKEAMPYAMDEDNNAAGAARGVSGSAPTTATKPNTRADTPTSPVVTNTNTTTATSTPNTLALAAALPFSRSSLAAPGTPMNQSLRRSARSTTARSSGVGADATPLPLKDLSVWELQREILRLCALRERSVARNEVLREWVRGVRGEGE